MQTDRQYIAIIDYQLSNLYSVKHAFNAIGVRSVITSSPKELLDAHAIVLPGVGAFGDAMNNLRKLKLIDPIKDFIHSGRRFMGVCLGMQLLFEKSNEFGNHAGLQVLKGDVVKFPSVNDKGILIKIPEIGWNRIYTKKKSWRRSPLCDIRPHSFMYFVHSYVVQPKNKDVTLSYTTYEEIEFCSSVTQKNIFAVQFHPEKSGENGIGIYKNWLKEGL